MKDKTRTKAQLMTELQELRQRIAELERSESVQDLIKTIVDGVISIDSEMKITMWNVAAENMFGYTAEEMLGQSVMKIVPESFHAAQEKGFTKFQKTGSGPILGKTLEFEGKRKDGTLIPIELSVSSRKVGNKHIATAIARDITQRKIENDKLNQRTHDLGERVKELNCLYELENIIRSENSSLKEVLTRTVQLIPPSWQYPEITGCCITLEGKKLKTKNFEKTIWIQKADIFVNNKITGSIEVCYLEEKPESDEGPFLKEERNLINAVGFRIGLHIEHKQKEDVLKDSEERLRILFEYAPDAYYLNDLKGNFIDGNKAAEKLTGYKRNELAGKNFLKLKLLSPEQMPKAAAFLAKNMMGKATGPDEFVLTRKDGTRVYTEISTNPVKVKGRSVVLGIARDISKVKQAENKLKLERAYIDQLFESALEAIVMADKNGQVMRVNDEFVRLFGFSSHDEVVGKAVDDLVVPDDAREIAESITNKVRMGDSVSLETVRQKKNGSLIDVSVLASPIEVDGNLLGTFGIYRDISERKQAEEALRTSEERYRSLFSNMTEGVCLHEVIYDDLGKAIDYKITDVNPSYQSILNLPREKAQGVLASKLYDVDEAPYLDKYAKVAEGGEPIQFETYFPPMDKHFSISVFSPEKGKFATVFDDITVRKQAKKVETALYKISEATNKTRNLDDLFIEIHRIVGELMPAENFYIALYDSANDTVILLMTQSVSPILLMKLRNLFRPERVAKG
jgi:PAS domain S-box-containing protein